MTSYHFDSEKFGQNIFMKLKNWNILVTSYSRIKQLIVIKWIIKKSRPVIGRNLQQIYTTSCNLMNVSSIPFSCCAVDTKLQGVQSFKE